MVREGIWPALYPYVRKKVSKIRDREKAELFQKDKTRRTERDAFFPVESGCSFSGFLPFSEKGQGF